MIPFALTITMSNEDKSKATLLVEEYRSLMIYCAEKILKDRALAEDAAQEGFIRILRNLHKVGDVKCHKTRGLMVIIVKRVAIDIYNKRAKSGVTSYDEDEMTDIPDSSPGVLDKVIGMDEYNNIVDIMNSLPDTLRDITQLAFVHKYDYKEISELLNISYDNVRQRVSRARSIIKSKLNK